MLAKGFGATTVEEICGAAGVTKGAFFHYFGSKEDLGRAVLERFCRTLESRLETGAFRHQADPLQRVYEYLEFMRRLSKEPILRDGCLLGVFSQEIAETQPRIRTLCATGYKRWADGIRRLLDEARAAYRPATAIDTQSLAMHLIASLEGALLLARATRDKAVLEENIRHCRRYLESVFEGRSKRSTIRPREG